ncbi:MULTISPECIES: TOBE domain-containing protein [Brevibacterium]|uniref:MerR family transcriptional regulator n=2 Tax=Brevibacterium TaxID=1696 RepID=A0A2A3ZUN5_BREAU|nr:MULTISPECIES: TOBE domain-containing protein [Brevibacterium]AZL05780.1 MerR family transcriptional regulator [Brevibacterium aurantiacum]AZL12982.1 MerR family transcriptional regulator [Brevibacterium aurantiacum]MDN5551188.1 TOBE domain-containing protein [Brevibacterium sp.]PCC49389.1 MerR family transcriptional regulator [Brevibacterium aurantiacum]PCC55237.1 MerR family transcriptional regulator [Brevibacterium aurantiacum]
MTELRINDAARFLGVSDDTIRRWISDGKLTQHKDASNRAVVEGRELAALAQTGSGALEDPTGVVSSARNRFAGLVTDVVIDGVMAQVSLQCGPFRVVSLMSAEACRQLELEPGSLATASVKATMVSIDSPGTR